MSQAAEIDHAEAPKANGKGRAIAKWQDFESELREREQNIASMLPRHVSRERYMASAVAAVKQNPELLTATPRSLFAAVTKSAQDGLLPDGREGVITIYNEKKKGPDNKDYWEKVAQWNPMTYGLRKRAREIDNIIIDAQVVHQNDEFLWVQGDEPRIEHKPAPLGQDRGPMVGAYAIFKAGDGTILHREVMDANQIGAVREQSKAQNSLMWTKFREEGWRKTVVRRGIKTVPCSEKLETIVRRDDDLFDFDERVAIGGAKAALIAPPPAALQASIGSAEDAIRDAQNAEERASSGSAEPTTVKASKQGQRQERPEPGAEPVIDDPERWLSDLEGQFAAASSAQDVIDAWEANAEPYEGDLFPHDFERARRAYEQAMERFGEQ